MNGNPITEEMRQDALKRLSCGETLTSICKTPGYPMRSYFVVHFGLRPEWKTAYQQARDDGFDAIAEECMAIADDSSLDYVADKDGNPVLDREHVQRSKLRIWTRLELLKKWDPKRYGELLKLGGDDKTPLTVVIQKFGSA